MFSETEREEFYSLVGFLEIIVEDLDGVEKHLVALPNLKSRLSQDSFVDRAYALQGVVDVILADESLDLSARFHVDGFAFSSYEHFLGWLSRQIGVSFDF